MKVPRQEYAEVCVKEISKEGFGSRLYFFDFKDFGSRRILCPVTFSTLRSKVTEDSVGDGYEYKLSSRYGRWYRLGRGKELLYPLMGG